MFELFKSKSDEGPKKESEIISSRERAVFDAVKRAEGDSFLKNATEEEVQGELAEEALKEDEKRRAA